MLRTTPAVKQFRVGLIAVALLASLVAAKAGLAALDVTVFDAPPAEYAPAIAQQAAAPGSPMRILTVEDRVGVARKQELVRVPLFFHDGECKDPNSLVIYDAADTAKAKPIAYQADDIRRAPQDSGISRMHIYFYTDLEPWQRRQFIVLPGQNPGAKLPALKATEADGKVTLAGDELAITFVTQGKTAGGITLIKTPFAQVAATDVVLAPRVKLFRQDAKLKTVHEHEITYQNPDSFEVRELKYATGPLFAKLRLKVGPPGVPDTLETTYLIPRQGSTITSTLRTFAQDPQTGDTVSANWPNPLWGYAKFGNDAEPPKVVSVGGGLRKLTRNVHNFRIYAAVSDKSGFSFMNVPYTAMGGQGVYIHDKGELVLMGPGNRRRDGASNSSTIRAWWYQANFVLSPTIDPEKLWELACANQQTLTAIVDEPAITAADMVAQCAEVAKRFWEIKYWGRGWYQDAGIHYLAGNDKWKSTVQRVANPAPPKTPPTNPNPKPKPSDITVEAWTPGWVKQQLAEGKTYPLDRPQGSDKDVAGRVEPYPVGYGMGNIPTFAAYVSPGQRLDQICLAVGQASKLTNGGLYKNGFPMIRAFSNALNMQIGAAMFGIHGGKAAGDSAGQELVTFYRDVLRSPGVIAIYGRGQRCYSGDIRNQEQSDSLYQAISDMWMRVIELNDNEDLMLHPAVYGRYFDAVDVLADQQHAPLDPEKGFSWDRANFFRTQWHDHRWEAWDALPLAGMFRGVPQGIASGPVGLTDAVYFVNKRASRGQNWATLMNYFHPLAVLQNQRLETYEAPKLPPLPQGVNMEASGRGTGGVEVTWQAVPGAVGYRIYSAASEGDALTFLNSPYGPQGKELVKGTQFIDPAGGPETFYFVTAVDAKGYESRWFPNEPAPVAIREK
ncbi:MAG: hypothetical protein WD042_14750 [Phycisphaeraceae bacterium]